MNILILGDSYASWDHKDKSWTRLLGKKINANIDVIAQPGQALYFCYKNLKKIKKEYDYYLILVTTPFRLYVNQQQGFPVNVQPKDELSSAAHNYFKLLLNVDYCVDVQELIIEKIKDMLKDKKYFLMPCFKESGIKNNFCLFDIKTYEDSFMPEEFILPSETYRCNHLFPANNEILADYFADIIKQGHSDIDLKSFVLPPRAFLKK